jgi:hypothetical protein
MGNEAVLPLLVSARFSGDPCVRYIWVVTKEALSRWPLLIKLDSTKVLTGN